MLQHRTPGGAEGEGDCSVFPFGIATAARQIDAADAYANEEKMLLSHRNLCPKKANRQVYDMADGRRDGWLPYPVPTARIIASPHSTRRDNDPAFFQSPCLWLTVSLTTSRRLCMDM